MGIFGKFSGEEAVLAVDIGTASIKAAEFIVGKGGVSLVNYAVYEMDEYFENAEAAIQTSSFKMNEEFAAERLRRVLKTMKPKAKNTLAALPAFTAFSTLIELPKMSPKEVASAIPFQSKQYIPAPLETVKIDWFQVGERTDESGTVLHQYMLVSVGNAIVERFSRVIKAAGLKPARFEIENVSLARALTTGINEPTLIVDIGARSTSLTVATDGRLQFAAQTDFAGASLTQVLANSLNITSTRAEGLKVQKGLVGTGGEQGLSTLITPMLDAIINEASRAIQSFERTYRKKVRGVVLSGGGSKLLGIGQYFASGLSLPVELANPLKGLGHPGLSEAVLAEIGPSLAVTVGLALGRPQ